MVKFLLEISYRVICKTELFGDLHDFQRNIYIYVENISFQFLSIQILRF